jgi:hypothetical protein
MGIRRDCEGREVSDETKRCIKHYSISGELAWVLVVFIVVVAILLGAGFYQYLEHVHPVESAQEPRSAK